MSIRKFSKKKAHIRYRLADGTIVPGGSTISSIGESEKNLIKWAHERGLEGLDTEAVMKEAGAIGTVAHGLIQCHFQGDEADFSEFSQDEIEQGTKLYEKFLRVWEQQGLTWIASELSLVSEAHKYGGTLDLLVWDKHGELALADVKSNPRIYPKFYRQLAGYEYLYNETHDHPIEQRLIIRLDKISPTKTEVLWLGNMADHFEVFLRQLDLYYAFKKV